MVNEEYQDQFAGWIGLDGIHDFPQAETARNYESILNTAQDGLAALRTDGLLLPDFVRDSLLC